MTKPVYTDLYCSVCGTKMGSAKGVEVSLDLLCDNPLCSVQLPTSATEARDQLINFAATNKIPVTSIAKHFGLSRQRVYQVIEQQKQGV